MQYILTQQEYDELLNKSNDDLMERYAEIRDRLFNLRIEHAQLQDKYNRLLVFGVSTNNEKLKDSKCKELS
jgi:predicted nuclease with TOPRIM domain